MRLEGFDKYTFARCLIIYMFLLMAGGFDGIDGYRGLMYISRDESLFC